LKTLYDQVKAEEAKVCEARKVTRSDVDTALFEKLNYIQMSHQEIKGTPILSTVFKVTPVQASYVHTVHMVDALACISLIEHLHIQYLPYRDGRIN